MIEPEIKLYPVEMKDTLTARGVATLGSSRHVPTHNFHKIVRKTCIK